MAADLERFFCRSLWISCVGLFLAITGLFLLFDYHGSRRLAEVRRERTAQIDSVMMAVRANARSITLAIQLGEERQKVVLLRLVQIERELARRETRLRRLEGRRTRARRR